MKGRIVVKIGSSLLTDENGQLDITKLEGHVATIAKAYAAGYEVVLVTSAAIAAGFKKLGFNSRPKLMAQKQASAAVGQGLLMQYYNEAFNKFDIAVAQVLLTKQDLIVRESYNNAFNTLTFLLEKKVVPIINQNDTTAIEEISFGDNDTIAARVAALIRADLCIIFTDTAGLFDADPLKNPQAKHISYVKEVTPQILEMTGDSASNVGTGGMRSKVLAAQLAGSLGVKVYIGDGRDFQDDQRIIKILNNSGAGTYFDALEHEPLQRKKQWMALYAKTDGTLIIDEGAVKALLEEGRSLLPVGIKEVFGNFEIGDIVEVRTNTLKLIGKGIVNYDSLTLRQIAHNLKTHPNNSTKEEAIHRDDWVASSIE